MSEQTVTLKFTTAGGKEVTAVVRGVTVAIDDMGEKGKRAAEKIDAGMDKAEKSLDDVEAAAKKAGSSMKKVGEEGEKAARCRCGVFCLASGGKTYCWPPVYACICRSVSTACRDRGTICACRVFILAGGSVHSAASKSSSAHSIATIPPRGIKSAKPVTSSHLSE